MTPHRIVIVGNGMAGARLVEGLLARAQAERPLEIVVFGDEPGGCYNRILLSGLLAGTYRAADIVTNPVEWYAANHVRLHAGRRVTRIDLDTRQVCADGLAEPFDSLVLATGSSASVPPLDGLRDGRGALKAGAFVFRTMDDCEGMLAMARHARTAAVVGGGLLGLEAARGLRHQGLDVQVVHLSAHVMDAQLDPPGSETLARQLAGMGLTMLTSRSTVAVLGHDRVDGLRFSDGSEIACDLLVIATGIRPNVELAERAGLDVKRGIVVGDDLACAGASDVYAIGECAEHRGHLYGLVAPVWEQADVLAARLTGTAPDATYVGSRLATRLKVAGLDVAVMGDKVCEGSDEVISYAEPSRGIYTRLIVRDNRLVGAILIGSGAIVPTLTQHFLEEAPLTSRRSDLLFPPTTDAPLRAVEQIPDAARICDCNAVSKGQIVQAVLQGARSLQRVRDVTRAATGCGSCRPEVQRIVDHACRQVDAHDVRAVEDIKVEAHDGDCARPAARIAGQHANA